MKHTITPEEHARIKRRRWRQTLGLLITVLVLIGFITVLRAGVGLVANLFDDTAQKLEYEKSWKVWYYSTPCLLMALRTLTT